MVVVVFGGVYAIALLFLAGNSFLYMWFYRVVSAGHRESGSRGFGSASSTRSEEGRSMVSEARVHYTVRPTSNYDGQSLYGHSHYGQRPLGEGHYCKYSTSWNDDGGCGEAMAPAGDEEDDSTGYHEEPPADSVL